MISRRVLITGASRGIGYAVATRLAEAAHLPVGLARNRVPDFPGEFHEVDLADREATQLSWKPGTSTPWSTTSA